MNIKYIGRKMNPKQEVYYTHKDLAELQIELLSKLSKGKITMEELKWFVSFGLEQKEKAVSKVIVNPYLKILSVNETLIIDALNSGEFLVGVKDILQPGVSIALKNTIANKPAVATKEQVVDVYQQVRRGTLAQMYCSLGADLDKLCLTQAQINNFSKKYPDWLRGDGYATFFMFKFDGQYLIDRRCSSPSGQTSGYNHLGYEHEYGPECSYRLVVPRVEILK
jgi:hypothetical protein